MILKKPYAFLIKKFRLIHIVLTLLIGYLLFRTYNIYNFFSRYVSNTYATLSDAVPSNYITIFMFLIVIIIVVFSLAMYLLMKKKEKPKTFYILLSVYYILYLVGLILYFVLFKSMDSNALSIRNAMVLRDVTLIISLPQIAFLILSFIRGVGFDIKKFNFSKDLKELDLSEEDNEEFEFVLGVDSYKYFRYLRRRIREFKYYVLENKFMFTILASLTAIIFVIMIILNFTVYNRTYNKNQKFTANNLSLQVNNSYLTNIDYRGQEIEDGKYFLVVNITFSNSSGSSTVLELTNYELLTNDGKVYPTLTRNSYFVDFGAGYSKEKIENDSSSTYILVYELSKKQVAKKYTLRVIDEVEYKAGTVNSKVKNVSIKPSTYYDIEDVGTYDVGNPITFYDSILENSSLLVNSYEFKNKFTYKYEACIRYDCKDMTDVVTADAEKSKTLLVLDGNLSLDDNSTFALNKKTSLSFFDAFVQIRYDDKISAVTNATPQALTDQYILQVDSQASKASKIDLVITIRNKRYILNLK